MSKEVKVTGRVLNISEATKKRNPGVFGPEGSITNVPLYPPPPTAKEIDAMFRDDPKPAAITAIAKANLANLNTKPRKSTDEEKLNKTERAYLAYLRMIKVPQLRIQAITLKLADDCRLTMDFTYVDANGRMVFVDVKGFQREDALIKAKTAARMFPEFIFHIVKKSPTGWDVTEVKP